MKYDGRLLRLYREHAEIKQHDLARQVGVQPVALCRWERNKATPRERRIKQLADVLDLDEYLLYASDDEREMLDAVWPEGSRTRTASALATLHKADILLWMALRQPELPQPKGEPSVCHPTRSRVPRMRSGKCWGCYKAERRRLDKR